ncbi:MAG: hypothetical protein L0206_06465, partial [Actinobacteria bacterium]|nr:hypothetical protein [Actinomycetota bacterium]
PWPYCALPDPYDVYSPPCSTNLITIRHSFLKRTPARQYEALDYPDQSRFDRFGLFRIEQNVVDRSVGGIGDPSRGVTDAKNYAAVRHNIWRQWHEVNEDGTAGPSIPYTEREVRPIVYYMTKDMPLHLIRTSYEVAADWNVHYMRTVRELRGEEAPDPATIPEGYDPYAEPNSARNPYDCWIHTADGQPGSNAEPTYAANQAEEDSNGPTFDADFGAWRTVVMDGPECVLVGRVNSCIAHPDDPDTDEDESMPCEERGDLRYKFLSYVSQPGTPFLGVATLRGDPITGEYISGDANIGGPALDSYRTRALLWHDIASGRVTPETVTAGQDVRDYFEELGRVDAPAVPRRDYLSALSIPGTGMDSIRTKFQRAVD